MVEDEYDEYTREELLVELRTTDEIFEILRAKKDALIEDNDRLKAFIVKHLADEGMTSKL